MNVARILYPVKVLGPGDRIGIWLCGCNRACPGCSNPELWSPRPEFELSVENLCHLINQILVNHPVDGITITGGEPFQQAADLWMLISRLSNQLGEYVG
jgi:anaerobic ribonucleoside-triphosphate reductase activating protein